MSTIATKSTAAFTIRYVPNHTDPFRYGSVATKHLSLFWINALEIQHRKNGFYFIWGNQRIDLHDLTDVQSGQHGVLAEISPNQPQLFPGVPNESIRFKTYRDHCILLNPRGSAQAATTLTSKAPTIALTQYDQLEAIHYPLAQMYNRATAETDGFFLVEYVPHPFVVSWNVGTKLRDLSADQRKTLDEVRVLFEMADQAKIDVDLQPGNLRRRADQTLVYSDLRENETDASDLNSDFVKMLESFHCEAGDEIYNYLIQNMPELAREKEEPFQVLDPFAFLKKA